MNQYRTTVIVTPVLTDAELKDTVSGYVKFLQNLDAEIIMEDVWGLRQLAYPIKKKSSGFYFVVEYKAPTGVIDKLELAFRRDESILRFLTVRLDKYAAEFYDKKRKGLIGKKKKEAEASEETK